MLGVDGWVEVDRSGPAVPFHDLLHRELCRVHSPPVTSVVTFILSAPEVRAFELRQFVTNCHAREFCISAKDPCTYPQKRPLYFRRNLHISARTHDRLIVRSKEIEKETELQTERAARRESVQVGSRGFYTE